MLGLYLTWRLLRLLRGLLALALLCGALHLVHPVTVLEQAAHGRGPLGPTITHLRYRLTRQIERLHRI